jgi:hypothetical protein
VQFVKIVMRVIPFPEPVATFFVRRFVENLDVLVLNQAIPDAAFTGSNTAKASADTAEKLLRRNNPTLLSAWCASRDRREGTVHTVLQHWKLPPNDQAALASKALSADAAHAALKSPWMGNAAKCIAARRASADAVLEWLATDPTDISDQEFLDAMGRLATDDISMSSVGLYAALHSRPHLLAQMVSGDLLKLAMAACAFADHIDHAAAFERIEATTDPHLRLQGLLNLLDHPALDPDVRERGFALAEHVGAMHSVYSLGCPSPGSMLVSPVPLSEIDDARLLEALASRSPMVSAARPFQFVELAAAPAASTALVHRIATIQPARLHESVAAARTLRALALRIGHVPVNRYGDFWRSNEQLIDVDDNRRASVAEAAALAAPCRNPGTYDTGSPNYWGTSGDQVDCDEMSEMSLDAVIVALSSYRAHRTNPQTVADVLGGHLGTGEDEASLRRWENFILLAAKTAPSMALGKVASTAARLS